MYVVPERCPVCGRDPQERPFHVEDAFACTCAGCGRYEIGPTRSEAEQVLKVLNLRAPIGEAKAPKQGAKPAPLSDDERLRLSAAIRKKTDEDERARVHVTPESIPKLIEEASLPSDDERAKILVRELREHRIMPNFSPTNPAEHREVWAARTFVKSWADVRKLITSRISKYVTFDETKANTVTFGLTEDGIAYADAIIRERDGS